MSRVDDDSQTFGQLWLGAVVLWIWHLWPANNKRTAERLADLEAKAAKAEADANRSRQAVELADERLRSMERVLSLISLVEHERNPQKVWPPTELEKALASGLARVLKARQDLGRLQEDRDGPTRK